MEFDPGLRQRDGVSCGPAVAVAAGAMLDPHYRRRVTGADGAWQSAEQQRVHARVNRIWPRALGTSPWGMVAAIEVHSGGMRYRWRPCRGLWGARDSLADVRLAVGRGLPVAMLIGNVVPRHWVLLLAGDGSPEGGMRCYEPSSGEVRPVTVRVRPAALRLEVATASGASTIRKG